MYNAFTLSELKYNFCFWCRNRYPVPHTELIDKKDVTTTMVKDVTNTIDIMHCSLRFIDISVVIRKNACFDLIIKQVIIVGLDFRLKMHLLFEEISYNITVCCYLLY